MHESECRKCLCFCKEIKQKATRRTVERLSTTAGEGGKGRGGTVEKVGLCRAGVQQSIHRPLPRRRRKKVGSSENRRDRKPMTRKTETRLFSSEIIVQEDKTENTLTPWCYLKKRHTCFLGMWSSHMCCLYYLGVVLLGLVGFKSIAQGNYELPWCYSHCGDIFNECVKETGFSNVTHDPGCPT